MSAGAFFRASVRRELELPPVWQGRARAPSTTPDQVRGGPPPRSGEVLAGATWPELIPRREAPQGPLAARSCSEAEGGGNGSEDARPDGRAENRDAEADIPRAACARPGAASRDGSEGRAPEGSSGAAEAERVHAPANARPARAGPIDLAAAPSAMERRAARFGRGARDPSTAFGGPPPRSGEVLPCRCGSRGGTGAGLVPAWFGRDCIEADCPLKAFHPARSAARPTGRPQGPVAERRNSPEDAAADAVAET